jgi:hypothetical protein
MESAVFVGSSGSSSGLSFSYAKLSEVFSSLGNNIRIELVLIEKKCITSKTNLPAFSPPMLTSMKTLGLLEVEKNLWNIYLLNIFG